MEALEQNSGGAAPQQGLRRHNLGSLSGECSQGTVSSEESTTQYSEAQLWAPAQGPRETWKKDQSFSQKNRTVS